MNLALLQANFPRVDLKEKKKKTDGKKEKMPQNLKRLNRVLCCSSCFR